MSHFTLKQICDSITAVCAIYDAAVRQECDESELQALAAMISLLQQSKLSFLQGDYQSADRLMIEALGSGILRPEN